MEQRELQILWVAVVCYVLAGVVAIFGVVLKKAPHRFVLGSLLLGIALLSTSLGLRWERLGHGPFITLFEILASNVWSFSLIFALAYWRYPSIRGTAAVVMPIVFVMLGWMALSSTHDGHFPRSFRTPWLYIHVGLSKLFLGTVLVAVGMAGVILLRRAGIGVSRFENLPVDERLDDLAYRFMALGIIFQTLMLISGAIWAQDAWGRYWAWDPLETWSFITWIMLAFALHWRLTMKSSPMVGSCMILGVFVFAFLTFFGVPFVTESPHKGAV